MGLVFITPKGVEVVIYVPEYCKQSTIEQYTKDGWILKEEIA